MLSWSGNSASNAALSALKCRAYPHLVRPRTYTCMMMACMHVRAPPRSNDHWLIQIRFRANDSPAAVLNADDELLGGAAQHHGWLLSCPVGVDVYIICRGCEMTRGSSGVGRVLNRDCETASAAQTDRCGRHLARIKGCGGVPCSVIAKQITQKQSRNSLEAPGFTASRGESNGWAEGTNRSTLLASFGF